MNRIERMSQEERLERADFYKELMKLIDLSSYKKTPEICEALGMCERVWRKHVENIMNLYRYGLLDKLVIGTPKGYIYTNDPDLILAMCRAKEKQFKSMAYNCYRLRKELLPLNNYSFNEFLSSAGD
ncbi:hypothetical protein ACQQ4G_003113 [Listeria monocytogenes]